MKWHQSYQITKRIRISKERLDFKILMIMNYLNGVWSDTYILQIFIQQALKRLGKSLYEKLILKTYSFLSKGKMFKKLEKRIVLAFTSVFGYEYEKKYLTYVSKKYLQKIFDNY